MIIFFTAFVFCCMPYSTFRLEALEKWVVYYDDKASFDEFDRYDLMVFDTDYYPDFKGIMQQKKTILGYISLGEVENSRIHYKETQEMGILLNENSDWPGSYFVDIRDAGWSKFVIEELIPRILFERYNGIFLDTLDNAILLEQENPVKYRGMKKSAINLVRAIRMHYPKIKIMMNRAYELIPDVGNLIDYELGESVYATYDFQKKEYNLVDNENYLRQLKILKDAANKFKNLKIYTLDYADSEDLTKIADIYKQQRQNGFIPYVSTINLDKIIQYEEIE